MKKEQNGYLTVFLSLILTILLSLTITLIKGAYESTMRLYIECAVDTGMNNILAEYHRKLLEQYDLFFIDTSYGTNYASIENTQNQLKQYISGNLNTEDLTTDILYRDFLALRLDDAQITEMSAACDEGGRVYRNQAISYAKEKYGIGYIQEIKRLVETVEAYALDSTDVNAAWDAIQQTIEEIDGSQVEIAENRYITIEVDNPVEHIYELKNSFILGMVMKDTSSLSTKTIQKENLLSYRIARGNITKGTGCHPQRAKTETITDEFFFQEYLMDKFGCYTEEKENNCLDYEIEYILVGKDKDIENLEGVVIRLLALREASNILHLMGDDNKRTPVRLLAKAIALLCKCEQIALPIEYTILFAWSYIESLYDVSTLLDGGKIPLMKTNADWHYGYENLLSFTSFMPGGQQGKEGLSYTDYLRIFLALNGKKENTEKSMDLIEQNIRMTEGNSYFRFDACIDSLLANIKVNSRHGQSYVITRRYAYE